MKKLKKPARQLRVEPCPGGSGVRVLSHVVFLNLWYKVLRVPRPPPHLVEPLKPVARKSDFGSHPARQVTWAALAGNQSPQKPQTTSEAGRPIANGYNTRSPHPGPDSIKISRRAAHLKQERPMTSRRGVDAGGCRRARRSSGWAMPWCSAWVPAGGEGAGFDRLGRAAVL